MEKIDNNKQIILPNIYTQNFKKNNSNYENINILNKEINNNDKLKKYEKINFKNILFNNLNEIYPEDTSKYENKIFFDISQKLKLKNITQHNNFHNINKNAPINDKNIIPITPIKNINFPKITKSSEMKINKINNLNNNYNSIKNLKKSYCKKGITYKEICPLCKKEIDIIMIKSHIKLHPSKIFDWLYLGNYRNSKDINDLKSLKINYILNCAKECKFEEDLPTDITCLHIKVRDLPNIKISKYFDETNDFIHKAKLSGGKILVHCYYGSSRSASFIIAYMIKYLGYTTEDAIYYIKDKRAKVDPNTGFLFQLKNYERKIRKQKNEVVKEK